MLLKAKTVNRVLLLPIEAIIPNPNQPRQLFDVRRSMSWHKVSHSTVCCSRSPFSKLTKIYMNWWLVSDGLWLAVN